MRILHATDRVTSRGGAHRHLQGVIAWQVERGHDVHLAAGQIDEPAAVPVHRLPGLAARADEPVDLDTLVGRVRPDVVHLHTVVNPLALEGAARVRAVMTVQDHRYFCPARGKWTLQGHVCRDGMNPAACAECFDDAAYFETMLGLTRRRLEALRALRIVVLSRYMKAELAAVGVDPAAVRVIPPFVHGLDPDAEPDGPPCVLFVGRLALPKGALDAVSAWRRSGVSLPLVMAGTGPLRVDLEAAGAQVLGWLGPAALARVYRRGRALLFPSRWQEPYGIAGVEALTMGVPVVAWRSGGIEEWHPGPGLVPWGDVDALAEALRGAVENPRPARVPAPDREERMTELMDVYREVAG